MGRTRLAGLLLLAPVLLGGGCSDPGPEAAAPSRTPATTTGAEAGLAAELRQSSLDVARGQMQVWVENATGAALPRAQGGVQPAADGRGVRGGMRCWRAARVATKTACGPKRAHEYGGPGNPPRSVAVHDAAVIFSSSSARARRRCGREAV